jgi:hypothetical protein
MSVLEVVANSDLGERPIREYFKAYLKELLIKGEGFSGKRPLGNSGWDYDLTQAVQDAGLADNRTHARALLISSVDDL